MNSLKDLTKEMNNKKNAFAVISSLLNPRVGWMALIVFIATVEALLCVASSVIVWKLIDSIGGKDDYLMLAFYAVILFVDIILAFVLSRLRKNIGEKMYKDMQKDFYDAVLSQKWQHIISYSSGELQSRMDSDGGQIVSFAANTVPSMIAACVQLVISLYLVIAVAPWLVLIILGVSLLYAATLVFFRYRMIPIQKKARESDEKAEAFSTESFSSLLTLKSFRAENRFKRKWEELIGERYDANRRRDRIETIYALVFDFLSTLIYLVFFAWSIINLSRGSISYGMLSMMMVLQSYILKPVSVIVSGVPQFIWTSVAASRVEELFEFADTESDSETSVDAVSVGVKISNVTFGYMENSEIFKDFSLKIDPGEFVCITGHSGCGKTTLIHIIMNLVEVKEGNVSFFDENGTSLPGEAVIRNSIGYVPQGNTLFRGTLLENISLGDEHPDSARAEEALGKACALDFVDSLPGRLDFKIEERGHGISEGQSQRIAIARALYRRPSLLILDEATSALDTETEKTLLSSIKKMESRPTIICITHRSVPIEFADRTVDIYELNRNRP